MENFEITLKNEKRNSYKKSLLIIILLNLIAFVFLAYLAPDHQFRNKCFFATGSILVCLLADIFWKQQKIINTKIIAVLLIILFYLLLKLYWPASAMLLILFLYRVSTRTLIVFCSEKEIIYPSFPKRRINWNELNAMLLKDDLLTIDFKNNRLIQQYIEPDITPVNEKEFNDFCIRQLKK